MGNPGDPELIQIQRLAKSNYMLEIESKSSDKNSPTLGIAFPYGE